MALISGTFTIDASIFERWAESTHFFEDLEHICAILQFRTGRHVTLDLGRLRMVHDRYSAHCKAWLEHLLPEGTSRLSHLKATAIFIEAMVEFEPILVGSRLPAARQPSYQDGGSTQMDGPELLEPRELQKFIDGGTNMIAWIIGYHICDFFERYRTDRIDPYISRTTDEFETDLVSALFSGTISAQSLHLILKALFLRD